MVTEMVQACHSLTRSTIEELDSNGSDNSTSLSDRRDSTSDRHFPSMSCSIFLALLMIVPSFILLLMP